MNSIEPLNLDETRRLLDGVSDDARYEAFTALYASSQKEAGEEIEAIISRTDPVLKIHLLRFLGRISEPRAVEYLARLLADPNHVVVDVAKNAFEKNQSSTKLEALLPLVKTAPRPAQLFAIERLSLGGKHELVDLLLDFLVHDPDEELLLAILSALRHFDDARLFPALLAFMGDARHEVRFRTVLIFGQLHAAGFPATRRELLRALNDPLARIRQAALWSLRIRPKRRDRAVFAKLSVADPDPLVRMETLPGLGLFPSPTIIEHLLKIIVSERARLVSLKAESVLTSLPKKALDRAVYRVLKSGDEKIRHRAVILFAEFQRGSDKYYRYLEGHLKKAGSDKEKLPYIEALASLGDERAFELLQSQLKESFLVAYTAMSALIRLWRQFPGHRAPLKHLEDSTIPDLLKQMILKYLVHSAHPKPYPHELVRLLFSCLQSSNLNIRYLAAQAVIQSETPEALEPLFAMILKETDAVSIKLLRESIVKHLSREPSGVLKLLASYRDSRQAMEQLLSMVELVDAHGGDFVMILLGPPYDLLQSEYGTRCARHVAQMVFKGRLSVTDLFESAHEVAGREVLAATFGSLLTDHPYFQVNLPVAVIKPWFDSDNLTVLRALLYVCVRAGSRDFIPLMVDLLAKPDSKGHEDISRALNLLMDVAA